MSNLGNVVPITDANLGPAPAPIYTPSPASAGQDYADVRLVIEEDQGTGRFIYKTLDRRTGQVIQQFPREEILRLREEREYAAGAIIDARA